MKYVVANGHPQFRKTLIRNSQGISDAASMTNHVFRINQMNIYLYYSHVLLVGL